LVTLAGLVIDDPATLLKTLTERMQGFLPAEAVGLLEGYADLTLRNADASVLVFAVLATFWSGWAAADALVKAVNRAYELQETRPWWKLWGISVLMVLGFVLVVVRLALVAFGPEVGAYFQSLIGLPETLLALWNVLRWTGRSWRQPWPTPSSTTWPPTPRCPSSGSPPGARVSPPPQRRR
jgi:membrane protein